MVTFPPAEVEISISPLAYEVDESAGFVDVIVQKIGGFSQPIFGSLTTVPGTASGMYCFSYCVLLKRKVKLLCFLLGNVESATLSKCQNVLILCFV